MAIQARQPALRKRSDFYPYLSLLITMVMFGSAFASSKVVVNEMPYEVAAALRFGGGGLLLMVFAVLFRGRSQPIGRAMACRAGLAGLIGVFAYNLCFFWGLSLAPSLDGSVIVPVLSPIITICILLGLGWEKASRNRSIGVVLGLVGAAIFVFGAGDVGATSTRITGDLLFVLGAFFWALYSLLSKAILVGGKTDALQTTTWATVSGACGLFILAIPQFSNVEWGAISNLVWANVVFLAIGPTAIAYLFFYHGLQSVSASTATIMMLTVPAFGTFFSMVFLGESFLGQQLIGTMVLLVGAMTALGIFSWLGNSHRVRAAD